MHNAITQSTKVNRQCPCPKGMAHTGTGKIKGTRRGGTLIQCSR